MKTSYAQLLVHLDPSPHAEQRLVLARMLALQHDAAWTALYAVTPSFVELPFAPEVGPGFVAALRGIDDERLAQAHAVYQRALAGSAQRATLAELRDEPIVTAFAQQALYADLLILGQHDAANPQDAHVPFDFVEAVLAGSGKPALVLPYAGAPADLAQTVVIAWKATREAARAVAAALPLLQRAQRVQVLSWAGADEPIDGAPLNLRGYLELHGVKAEWQDQGKEPHELGEMLLSRACDLGADLLVMGCYGHSRTREWVLGGTSRTVLRAMTVPVLLSH
jgi:nucleotide-binding universal stress UspA family protein